MLDWLYHRHSCRQVHNRSLSIWRTWIPSLPITMPVSPIFHKTCLTSKKLMFFKYVQWKMRWINNEIFTVLAPSFSICLALIGSKSNLGMLLVIVVLTSFYHVANAQYIHEISAVIIFSKVTIPVLNAAFIFSKCINWFKCSYLSNLQVTSKYWQGFLFFFLELYHCSRNFGAWEVRCIFTDCDKYLLSCTLRYLCCATNLLCSA